MLRNIHYVVNLEKYDITEKGCRAGKNPGPITKGKYILLLVVQWGSEITLSSLVIDNFQIIQNNNLQNLRLQDEQHNELKARINLKFKNNL